MRRGVPAAALQGLTVACVDNAPLVVHVAPPYVVVGGVGGVLVEDPNQESWEFMSLLERAWHYLVMEIDGPDRVWPIFDLDDAVIDRSALTGGPVPAGR